MERYTQLNAEFQGKARRDNKDFLSEQCMGSTPGFGKIPRRREWLPTPVFWPGEFHGFYSPWGHKESDTNKQLSLSFTTQYHKNKQVNEKVGKRPEKTFFQRHTDG